MKRTLIALAALPSLAATDMVLTSEIKEHMIDPCYETMLQQQGLDPSYIDMLKAMSKQEIDQSVASMLTIVRQLDSFSDRQSMYEIGVMGCRRGAESPPEEER